jgi:hypothetical protein
MTGFNSKRSQRKFAELDLEDWNLEFAPGCFDDFEGTQEELDALIEHIKEIFAAGKFLTESRPLTEEEFESLNETTQLKLLGMLDEDQAPKRNLN